MTDAATASTFVWAPDTWSWVLTAGAAGAVGGLIQALTTTDADTKGLKFEVRVWNAICVVLLGAVAAVAILWIVKPSGSTELISSSLIAGYAGRALMEALSARAKLAVSQQETEKAKTETADVKKDVHSAINALERATGTTSSGTMGGSAADMAKRQAEATDTLVYLREKYRGA
jgi:hypothetical protein